MSTVGLHVMPPKARSLDDVQIVSAWNLLPWAAKAPSRTQRRLNALLTRHALGSNGADIVVAFDPLAADLAATLGDGLPALLYHCLDAYEFQPQFSRHRHQLIHEERKLARRVAVRAASASTLAIHKESQWNAGPVATLLGAFEAWRPQFELDARIRSIGKTKTENRSALLVSALDPYKVDIALLDAIAEQSPRWTIHVVGATVFGSTPNLEHFLARPNVRHHGALGLRDIEQIAAGCSVGIIALSQTNYSRFSFPLKTWDYMALGLPVLAANAPALAGLPGVHQLLEPSLDQQELDVPSTTQRLDLLEFACGPNSVDERWRELEDLL